MRIPGPGPGWARRRSRTQRPMRSRRAIRAARRFTGRSKGEIFRVNRGFIGGIYHELVGALEHGFYVFPCIGNVIIPTDEVIFFRGVESTNQV